MRLVVNGKVREIEAEAPTLHEALPLLGYEGAHVATALNGDFVPAAERGETRLSPDDRIEVVAPMKGG